MDLSFLSTRIQVAGWRTVDSYYPLSQTMPYARCFRLRSLNRREMDLLKVGNSFHGSRYAPSWQEKTSNKISSVVSTETETSTSGTQKINGRSPKLSSSTKIVDAPHVTGQTLDFSGATDPLVLHPLPYAKKIVMVRHGLSTWNEEGRVQGSSDLSLLSKKGELQAIRCKESLSKIHFDSGFSSPIARAKSSAELIWGDRAQPLTYLDALKETNLYFLEGMLNSEANEQHPELFGAWREDPANFKVGDIYPVRDTWELSKMAWQEILAFPGERVLVVSHKSILRAMLCTALGLGPDRFRAMDIHNGGICVFAVNAKGEPMLESLNMTAHLHTDGVFYGLGK